MPFIILPCICFRENLKKEKPTWIVFIELNFTVALLLTKKTWDDRFAGKVGGMGHFKKWADDFEKGRELIPLYGPAKKMLVHQKCRYRDKFAEFPMLHIINLFFLFCLECRNTSDT